MKSDQLLIDREAFLSELQRVFDAQTAEILLGVLDKVAVQVRAAGVTREDFSELKQIVAQLAEEQLRTEQRLEDLAQRVAELTKEQQRMAEAQRRTEQRLEELAQRVAELSGALQRLVDTVGDLKGYVAGLAGALQRTVDTVGDLKGRVLESSYRDKAVAYFGRWLRRPQVVSINSLWDTLEACLPGEALDDVILVDLVVRGQPRKQPTAGEVWLAVEVSAVIDAEDVARARRQAALLQQAGYRAIPVVAGEKATLGAETKAHLHQVAMLQNGRGLLWEEALATWIKAKE